MQKDTEFGLQLLGMAFDSIHYSRNLNAPKQLFEYEMNFAREIAEINNGESYKVSLTANVWSKENRAITLTVTLNGFFKCTCEENAIKNDLLNYNTLAILFPYLRSQISLISTQPDMAPILIPPINIIALFKDVDEVQQVEEKKTNG